LDIAHQKEDSLKEADRLKFAIGSLELHRACDPAESPEAMLDRVIHILRGFVPFDIATFAEYATDRSAKSAADHVLVLGRYAVDDGKRFNWPARWLKVPSGILDWISGKELSVPNIDAFFQLGPAFDALRTNPVTQEYLTRNARSFVVSVLKKNGKPVVSLTLARKGGEPFTGEHQRILENLKLDNTLGLVYTAYKSESAVFHQEIRDLFSQHLQPHVVAKVAVRRLCQHFRWDYAAIFRLAHARGRFELVQQHNASTKRLLVTEGYTQAFDAGVLGRVLKSGRPIRVEDTSEGRKHGYIQIAPDARSCLCYPIVLDNETEWILDCESSEVGAFQYPDELELGALIREAQNTIALWFETRLNRALIENVEQGVIVVNQANRITRLNALASQLLGASPSRSVGAASAGKNIVDGSDSCVWGKDLKAFGADEEAKAVLASGHVAEKPLRLRGADGVERYGVASSRDAEDAFNRRIWRLTDPKGWDWVTALEYMRVTVQGVAQQTRGPLLLANALVAKARTGGRQS
jgi:putative methionine-R-sulfoxide reductase with GAF domain